MPDRITKAQLADAMRQAGPTACIWTNRVKNPQFLFLSAKDTSNAPNVARWPFEFVKMFVTESDQGRFSKAYRYYELLTDDEQGRQTAINKTRSEKTENPSVRTGSERENGFRDTQVANFRHLTSLHHKETDTGARKASVATLLIANREGGTDWGEWQTGGKRWSKKLANRFLLGCLLDYQIPSELAWNNAERLVKELLADPDDLWDAITSISETQWQLKRDEYNLHRFPHAHNRLWSIGKRICDNHAGDSRRLWEGKDSAAAVEALWDVGAGEQISRMIVGALRDCAQITSGKSDVKGDTYVRRVLGRAVLGEATDPETAVQLARDLHPADPWQLDAQLWIVGKTWCLPRNPECSQCYLASYCEYALARA